MKRIADVLTLSRLIAGLALILMGLVWGRRALEPAVALGLLAWSTDSVDGALARRDAGARPTWVGEQEIAFDAVLALGILAYFVLSGLFPSRFALIWIAVWALLYLWLRARAVLLLGMGGLDAMVIYALFRENASLGWVVVIWMVAVAFVDHRRSREVLRIFFRSAGEVLGISQPDTEESAPESRANGGAR